jgi:SAM-dependent methyltransferase
MDVEVLDTCNVCDSRRLVPVDVENNIWRCRSCGYVFDNPRPTSLEIAAFYSKPTQYDSWLSAEGARDALWRRRLRKLTTVSKQGTLLDIGAGTGQFLYHARSFFTQVSGTEVSKSAIETAKEKYELELIEGDVTDIEFGRHVVFDNITLFHVLEHVPNPRKTIERCWSLLSDGGVVVVAAPNDILSFSRRLKTRVKILLRRIGVRRFTEPGKLGLSRIALDGSSDEIHLSHFTPSVLRRLLENSGFLILKESLDPYYVATGIRLFRCHCLYMLAQLVKLVLRRNVYATIWIAGKKVVSTSHHDERHDPVDRTLG